MQNLLSQVAILPSLLQKIDAISIQITYGASASASEINQIFSSLVDILVCLENWDICLQRDSNNKPCYWPCDSSPGDDNVSLWFPDITMANVFTHLWSFQIVCLSEIDKLASSYPDLALENRSLTGYKLLDRIPDRTLALSKNVVRSMDYLMQDEMKLFGPASTFFPLKTAYERLKLDEEQNREYIAYCGDTVSRLVSKGLCSAPFFIFGR